MRLTDKKEVIENVKKHGMKGILITGSGKGLLKAIAETDYNNLMKKGVEKL